jgi:hypothetical protein
MAVIVEKVLVAVGSSVLDLPVVKVYGHYASADY